jgi:hypothetical protein
MQKNAKSAMQMQKANAMEKQCNAMRRVLTKSANANVMPKSLCTAIPGLPINEVYNRQC